MAQHAGDGPRERQAVEPQDLEAALAVRRELGHDYEPALVESFVERIESAVAARVDAQVEQMRREEKADRRAQLTLGIVSLGTGIPITAIAGALGDGIAGVVVAWAGITTVNVAHAWRGRLRR